MKSVWILDACEDAAQELVSSLPELMYEVRVWTEPEGLMDQIGFEPPDLVVLEHGLSGPSAVDVIRRIKEVDRRLPVIVVAEHTSSQGAIESMREGAYDYLPRETLPSGLEDAARRALFGDGGIIRTIGSPGPGDVEELGAIVGKTLEMVEIHKLIGRVATSEAPVLINGETGTGKELVARAIHFNSKRREGAFVAVNCAALPPDAFELDLFGVDDGGEGRDSGGGRVEMANGGTMLFDEIDAMSLAAQGRILTVMESGYFERPGTRRRVRADVRVIAATSKSLVSLMKQGKFRVDLFYHLKVVSVYMPPLRDRREDIPYLADHFLERAKAKMHREIEGMSPAALELLKGHSWPGNVRELEQSISHAVTMNRTGVLAPDDFELADRAEGWSEPSNAAACDLVSAARAEARRLSDAGATDVDRTIVRQVERALVDEALDQTGGNQVKAARMLGISRNTLRKRVEN